MRKEQEAYNYLKNNIISLGQKYDIFKVFSDFLTMSAYSISNAVNFKEDREKEYIRLINSYTKEEQGLFPKMFASLVDSLNSDDFNDVLGKIFEELNFQNKFKGQFFTPENICRIMTSAVMNKEEVENIIKEKGYVFLNDSACGSSRLMYSSLKFMKNNNINYHIKVFIEVQDISPICVFMSYIQLSLYGANARVILGNTLTNEIQDVFYTPFAILFPIRDI